MSQHHGYSFEEWYSTTVEHLSSGVSFTVSVSWLLLKTEESKDRVQQLQGFFVLFCFFIFCDCWQWASPIHQVTIKLFKKNFFSLWFGKIFKAYRKVGERVQSTPTYPWLKFIKYHLQMPGLFIPEYFSMHLPRLKRFSVVKEHYHI